MFVTFALPFFILGNILYSNKKTSNFPEPPLLKRVALNFKNKIIVNYLKIQVIKRKESKNQA